VSKGIECPHCGKNIPDVKELEVEMGKRDLVLSVGLGLGVGLFVSAAWTISWWGALGAFFIIAIITFLISSNLSGRNKKVKGG